MQLLFFIVEQKEKMEEIKNEVCKILIGINSGIIKDDRRLMIGLEEKIKKHDEILKNLKIIEEDINYKWWYDE